MNATEQYIGELAKLKAGDLALLRTQAGLRPDELLPGFDLFTGLWWPLRQRNERAPRRNVAWLIAKLYAFQPIPQTAGDVLARQLRLCQTKEGGKIRRYQQMFDRLLASSLDVIEPGLRWAVGAIASNKLSLDWVQLTDDLSIWERETTRLRWAEHFVGNNEGGLSC